MKIDFEEYEKQKKEEIIKGGKYIQIECIVDSREDAETPVMVVDANHTNPVDIAMAISILLKSFDTIIKKEPLVEKIMKSDEMKQIIKNLETGTIERDENNE